MAPGAALGEHTETGDLPPGRADTGRPLRARRMLGGSRGSHHSHSPEVDCIVTWATLKTREPTHCVVAGHGHRTRKPQSRDQTQVCPTPAATFSGRGFVCRAPGAPPRLALAGTRAASRWGGSSRRCGLYLESHQGGDSQVPAPVTGCAVACRGLCQSALGLPRPDGSGHVQRQRLATRPAGASPRHGDAAEGAAGGGPRRTPARGWAHPRLVCRMGNGCEQVDRPATSSSSPTAPEAPGARRHLPAEDSQER